MSKVLISQSVFHRRARLLLNDIPYQSKGKPFRKPSSRIAAQVQSFLRNSRDFGFDPLDSIQKPGDQFAALEFITGHYLQSSFY